MPFCSLTLTRDPSAIGLSVPVPEAPIGFDVHTGPWVPLSPLPIVMVLRRCQMGRASCHFAGDGEPLLRCAEPSVHSDRLCRSLCFLFLACGTLALLQRIQHPGNRNSMAVVRCCENERAQAARPLIQYRAVSPRQCFWFIPGFPSILVDCSVGM